MGERGEKGVTAAASIAPEDNFFLQQLQNLTYTSTSVLSFQPTTTLEGGHLSFSIPPLATGHVIHLSEAVLALEVKLVDKDGNKPADDTNVAPVCNFGAALFRSCRIRLNEVAVTASDVGAFGLRAYIENLCGLGKGDLEGRATLEGFYEDIPHAFDTFTFTTGGFANRRALFLDPTDQTEKKYSGKSVPVFSRLWCDTLSCPLPLVSGVGVKIDLVLQDGAYYICSSDSDAKEKKYRLKIESARLLITKRSLNSGLALNLEARMKEKALEYKVRRLEISKINIAASLQSFISENIVQSSLNPKRIFFILTRQDAADGDYSKNPFNFLSTGVEMVQLSLNGSPLYQNMSGNHDAFMLGSMYNFYEVLGEGKKSNGPPIDRELYTGGAAIFAFDLSASGRGYLTGVRQPAQEGLLRLEIRFSEALTSALYLFVLAEYASSFMIDSSRNITYNFIA